ncbi:hypothetical protein [Rhodococcus marinonascens]|uniref:hypothetical protein n=1 Tax=Rhodococcus marinonascens TaxID=38311 RepID=UPI0009328109|nr:hypothetical protein [Rhodococcus marinonascens]
MKKFNLGVTAVVAGVAITTVGQLVADAANQGTRVTLLLCTAFVAAVTVWRALNLSQEPAVFMAVTYLSYLPVAAIAFAVSGDYTRAGMSVYPSPILAVFFVEDPRTRQWINRIARYPEKNLRDDQK